MSQQNEENGRNWRLIRQLRRFALLAGALAVAIVINGTLVRLNASSEAEHFAIEQSVPNVVVVHPAPASEGETISLPGTLQAYNVAPIYARVPGYVKAWYKDIGAKVHRGDLLAEIDTPEVDQQIVQARADLANAKASQQVSETTAERWNHLLKIQAVSKQDAEEKEGDLAVKTALVKSAEANLARLLTMKTFARITAPFDGVVTERAIDIGNLVNAGAGAGGPSMFTIADIRKMRVYVRVPQNYSADIRDHLKAELTLPEYPGETFSAELVTTSNAISSTSNTLLVQLIADNADGKLKAGGYAQVTFKLPADAQNLSLPVSTLIFRGDGLKVATVGPDGRVLMKSIDIAADLGTKVEVQAGLSPTDQVIDNPPDSIATGDEVHVIAGAR